MLVVVATLQPPIRTAMLSVQVAVHRAMLASREAVVVCAVVLVLEPVMRPVVVIGQAVMLLGMARTRAVFVRRRGGRYTEQGRGADQSRKHCLHFTSPLSK
ncbi:hypothetical protein [Sphingomonas lenta]|uniref:Uncharacterized protein n=1 Tax=Sphingomonas lenta TaxID=1141887 RepID=A0A2A2SB95_9SPHN|nr:hypothetical protein [Sphingomonas lenta]PAX06465.1 hypothetical protein CKY28_17055 [Sphingomonas lenta]